MTSAARMQVPDTEQPAVLIADKASAEALLRNAEAVMNALIEIVDRESHHVRKGDYDVIGDLEADKAKLVRDYMRSVTLVREHRELLKRMAPVAVDSLRRRHKTFRAELQINLAVLATAKAVSESIIKGVADAVEAKRRPKTYGAFGTMARAPQGSRRGLAVDRDL